MTDESKVNDDGAKSARILDRARRITELLNDSRLGDMQEETSAVAFMLLRQYVLEGAHKEQLFRALSELWDGMVISCAMEALFPPQEASKEQRP
jgi:hypothetical protein